jgi:hypothetical protein
MATGLPVTGRTVNVSTKYRCHYLCHLEMSLSLASGVGRARSPRRSAAPDRRPRRFEIRPVAPSILAVQCAVLGP